MATKQLSVDLEESLYRRFKARVAYEAKSMTDVLTQLISTWLGSWGTTFFSHTVAQGEDLRSIANEHYDDGELYWAIAYFNDISFPTFLQPGQDILIPEPGTSPSGATPATSVPWGVPKDTVAVDIDADLHRRFKARAAFEDTTMTEWLYHFVVQWTGNWPTKTTSYTIQPGDMLSAIAFRFYNDATQYWAIAYLNGIDNPALIRVGQTLTIPEPASSGKLPAGESPFIFGIHDRGGEHLMAQRGKEGWVLITEEVGRNPHEQGSKHYADLESQGFGVIVRLNHGYHRGNSFPGTIPEGDPAGQNYRDFAVRCGNFVENSTGCHIWIIGNEMNYQVEWPGGANGQALTPQRYATCFKQCRSEIRGRAGHERDQVVIGAVAPWNDGTKYPGNERGDWIQYLADLLALLRDRCDGIALHTYTHSPEPSKISSHDRMNPPFQDRYFEFRTYREFMEAIPASMRGLPVYITETNNQGTRPWSRTNTRWVEAAYEEINNWNENLTHQKIRCLILYRWSKDDQWSFQDVPAVKDDFLAAMDHDYRWWK